MFQTLKERLLKQDLFWWTSWVCPAGRRCPLAVEDEYDEVSISVGYGFPQKKWKLQHKIIICNKFIAVDAHGNLSHSSKSYGYTVLSADRGQNGTTLKNYTNTLVTLIDGGFTSLCAH